MMGVTPLTGVSAKPNPTTAGYSATRRLVGSPPHHAVPQVSLNSIAHDTVHFGSAEPVSPAAEANTPDQKLTTYARQVLNTINDGQPLREGQPLRLVAPSPLLPLVRQVVEIAYRDFKSGEVHITKTEPELEALRRQFGATEKLDSVETLPSLLKGQGAAEWVIAEDGTDTTYQQAGLLGPEIADLKTRVAQPLSPTDAALQTLNPDEVLFQCLDLRPGQPLQISGQREHMPQILALAKRAMQNGTKLVRLAIAEPREFDLNIPYYQYASDAVIDAPPLIAKALAKEAVEKNMGRIVLMGADPQQYAGLDSARIQRSNKAHSKVVAEHNMDLMNAVPWTAYYLPTTASAKAAGYGSLTEALTDARKINRVGQLKDHFATLIKRQDQLNALVDQGYRKLRYVSMGADGLPDGKTDLRVGLTPKSKFLAASLTTSRGQKTFPNVPSEEVFTVPDATTAQGVVSATLPLSLHGKLITDLRVEFENGRVAKDTTGRHKISASQNEDAFRELIAQNEAEFGDRLGETAIVAGSPIFDLGRVFNMTLLDENAASHIAVGRSFANCIDGAMDIADSSARQAYMDEQKANPSTCPIHIDFMIGAPNVHVILENTDAAKPPITVVKDNQFQLVA